MSVTSALYTGVSGLINNGDAMNVIGNNISNVNTTGFKAGRTLFSDLLSTNLGKDSQEGTGVQLQAVQNIFTQGTSQTSANVTDLTIQGDSFFALQSPTSPATTQNTAYLSRNGAFSVNKDLDLVNADGYQVLDTSGKPIVFTNTGTSPTTDFGKITKIDPNGVITYLATDGVTQNYYNASGGIAGANPADSVNAAVSSASSAITVASAASATLFSTATTANTDALAAAAAGTPPGSDTAANATAASSLAAAKAAFSAYIAAITGAKTAADAAASAGTKATATSADPLLATASNDATSLQSAVTAASISTGGDAAVTLVAQQTTAPTAADYLTAATAAQNDFVTIAPATTTATTSATAAAAATGNTASRAVTPANAATVQRIALVHITDPTALTKAGGSLYQSNANCGVSTAAFSLAANSPNGTSESILSNSLEASNVDMSTEFVNMITTQRAYSANSKTITTADQMTQEVLGLIR